MSLPRTHPSISAAESLAVTARCQDCGVLVPAAAGGGTRACPACGSPRAVAHAELDELSIAHIDCDSFYASVERRDNPDLADKPVLVGGSKRGVVMACCYIARRYGIHSAMPMARALRACPDAVVVRPDMAKYSAVGREIKELMHEVTPVVEPISVDEAFLDLSGTRDLLRATPAEVLICLIKRIEDEIGVTASVGLSYAKYLAKIASDFDKPRGFTVIGRGDAQAFLAGKPVRILWGVGPVLGGRLNKDGLRTVGDLAETGEDTLVERYGSIGHRLHRFAHGRDARQVQSTRATKSISAETTFADDKRDPEALLARLWPLCETVSARLKKNGYLARTVTLKLKTADFRILTRSRTLSSPTQLAVTLFETARPFVVNEATGGRFRLIGIGAKSLIDAGDAPPEGDLFAKGPGGREAVEQAVDAVRARFGDGALVHGRSFCPAGKR
jgi:DNA polymerase-4